MDTEIKVIEALKTLQTTCKNTEDCRFCLLGNKNGDCLVIQKEPIYWTINEDPAEVWRPLI